MGEDGLKDKQIIIKSYEKMDLSIMEREVKSKESDFLNSLIMRESFLAGCQLVVYGILGLFCVCGIRRTYSSVESH